MSHPTVNLFGYQPSVDSQMTSAPHTQASITRWQFNFGTFFFKPRARTQSNQDQEKTVGQSRQ